MRTGGDARRARDDLRAQWRAAGWYPKLTVGAALRAGAREHPQSSLVFAPAGGEPTPIVLADLHTRSQAVAGRLYAAGVRPGDAVVVQAAADAASTEVTVALWSLGAVVVPMTVTATRDEIAHAIRETTTCFAIVAPRWRDRELAAELAEHRGDMGLKVLAIGADAPPGAVPLDSLESQSVPAGIDLDPDSVACVLYTSGSTAAPKGVRHSHETLLFGLNLVPADDASRTLATFPAGHVASVLGLLRPLVAGGTTVVMDRWSARAAAELIEEYRLTVSAGTPFFLRTLLDEAERSGRDISSLNRFLVGAAAVPPALVERAEAAGIISWRTYGSTEHPAISAGRPDDPPEKRRCTDGQVAPGNEARLLREDGSDAPLGEEGEIVARGPKQFLGYQDPAADTDAFVDSTWFRTGDLGRFDEDGYLIVTDRVKDIIIRGGENISAREVEDCVRAHPAVDDVAVCPAPDAVWGEEVCAFVITRPGVPTPTAPELAEYARADGLAAHKAPTRVVAVAELPRTAAGKVRKRDLRELL